MQPSNPDEPPVIIIVDDTDLAALEALRDHIHQRLPSVRALVTNNVTPSVNVLLETRPRVIISGLDPDRMRGYNFLRRAGDKAPDAYKVLLTDKHWDRALLRELDIIAALRRSPDHDTIIDLLAGLIFGEREAQLHEVAA